MRHLAGGRRRNITVAAVSSGRLDQLQLADIAGHGGLGHVEALLPQMGQQILLPVNGVLLDQIQIAWWRALFTGIISSSIVLYGVELLRVVKGNQL